MDLIRAGRTIYLKPGPHDGSHAKPHLWLVVTDPDSAGRIVAVMLRTETSFTDPTLVLDVGDHPFVHHRSSVHYSTAQWYSLGRIQALIRSGQCTLREDMSADLLERVQSALLTSPFTVEAVKRHCQELWE